MTATSRFYLSNHEVLREYFAPVHHDDPPPPLVEDDFYDEDDDPMPLLEDDCDSSESDTYWDDESVGDITAIDNDSYEEVDDLPSLPLVEEELNLYDDLPPLVDDDNVDLAGDMIGIEVTNRPGVILVMFHEIRPHIVVKLGDFFIESD